jgi:hypothetical protein
MVGLLGELGTFHRTQTHLDNLILFKVDEWRHFSLTRG